MASTKTLKTNKISKTGSIIKPNKSPLSGVFNKFVGEEKELQKYWSVVEEIKKLEPKVGKWSEADFVKQTHEFRQQLKGLEGEAMEAKLNSILPLAFAMVREASSRVLGMRHFDVQMIGGMVLNDGRVAEMKTGEGKTLVATTFVYLNSLPPKNQVHLVTVNDYLARRDASWMGQVYDFLGLTIGIIQNQSSFYFQLGADASAEADRKREAGLLETYEDGEKEDAATVLDVENLLPCERQRAYWIEDEKTAVDIVYGVNSEFGFDYLRDNMAKTPAEISQKAGHSVAVIDEVDSILIDEARTPLIISAQAEDTGDDYRKFAEIVSKLTPDIDFEKDEKRKSAILTELGVSKIEQMLGIEGLYGSAENVGVIHLVEQALRARAVFRKDKEYVVSDGEIVIVDENTGRMMVGRRFNQGLHQAIEAKEGVEVKPENKTAASITFQNYFKLYNKLAGMTGTAATESEELFKIYELLVVTIPTNREIVRNDFVDQIFKNEMGKFTAVVSDIKKLNQKGQPVLVGTTSIEKNNTLSQMLRKAGVPHELLNAKNHEQEARIVSNAGEKGAVTIATNIAGRGVDIQLGGQKPDREDKTAYAKWKKLHDEVKELGGLFVIGTERHESRRIDNQLRGRSGRQGDPGMSRFYISLEDYIIRVFGGDRAAYFKMLPIADHEAIENNLLNSLIEQAQKKIEGQNYDMRKHVTDYDDVINKQRQVIYTKRNSVLRNEGFDYRTEVSKSIYNTILNQLSTITKGQKKGEKHAAAKAASKVLNKIYKNDNFKTDKILENLKSTRWNHRKVAVNYAKFVDKKLDENWANHQDYAKSGMSRYIYLRAIDMLWTEHLVTIDHLNDSVRLRGYSQKEPLVEFKHDGMKVFQVLLKEIDKEIATTIFKVNPELVPHGIMQSAEAVAA